MSPPPAAATSWVLVLPVQRAARAKSRLVAPGGVEHSRLARAIATDTLDAVRGCPVVRHRIVVTSDEMVGPYAVSRGDLVVPDAGRGLAAAVAAGLARASQLSADVGVGVLLPDLPALTAADLTEALGTAAAHRFAFVPDAEGTGTVLLTARDGAHLQPAFGGDSAGRHAHLGAVRLDLDLPRLRRDVDTASSLRTAALHGVGPATSAALAAPHASPGGAAPAG